MTIVITHQTIFASCKAFKTGDLKLSCQEIVKNLSPKTINPKIRTILNRVSDLSMFKSLKEVPKKRFTNNLDYNVDLQFQQQIQKLIDLNVIRPQTMVVASTGHDIPMLAQLHKNNNLKFNSAFKLKFGEESGNKNRVSCQAHTWGNEIKQAESEMGNKTNGLFLGLDTHRTWKVDTTQLPLAQELNDLGITIVVHLIETSPTKILSSENTAELKEYYRNLEKEGIDVIYKGVDTRYYNDSETSIPLIEKELAFNKKTACNLRNYYDFLIKKEGHQ